MIGARILSFLRRLVRRRIRERDLPDILKKQAY